MFYEYYFEDKFWFITKGECPQNELDEEIEKHGKIVKVIVK